ncbi:GAF domain-containing protein [Methylomonas sp. CM2]|uniref:GAF domain-containing protein n=1 Tax=Methylomonas sp. CM2 TaxID=3417647 RepID=UPI003CE8F9E3
MSERTKIELDSFLLSQTKDINSSESIRANYFLQVLMDSTSNTANIPISTMEMTTLYSLPKDVYNMRNNKNIQALYAGEDNKKNLKQDIEEFLTPNLFESFSNKLTEISSKLFQYIEQRIDSKIKFSSTPPTYDKLGTLEAEFSEEFYTLSQHKDFAIIEDIRGQTAIKLLLFLMPFIQAILWRTKISNPPIYHDLTRMEPLWQVLVICWFYQKRDDIKLQLEFPGAVGILKKAVGLPKWSIQFFYINNKHPSVIGVTPPFFDGEHIHNQYLFYVRQGIYFKYCFLAYLSAFALNVAECPETENLVAVLLRRCNIEKLHRDSYIDIFRRAWRYIGKIEVEKLILYDLAFRDISLLGTWVCFLAEMQPFFEKSLNHLHRDDDFLLGIYSAFASEENSAIKGYFAKVNYSDIGIHIIDNPSYKDDGYCILDNGLECDELREKPLEENLWLKTSNVEIVSKFKNRSLGVKYVNTLFSSRMNRLATQSWRVELLSDWLQRHFSSKKFVSTQTNINFLGESGKYACRLLRELTRADVGVSLYQKDYGDSQCYLRIVADESDDAGVMSSLQRRQDAMDKIRREFKEKAGELSYCYQSIQQNRFLYEPNIDASKPAAKSYPQYRRPKSIMVMPLHMEQRLMGAIEIKGSQPHHFRWSLRLRIQQVASVLAPYFYRQQLLHSLSKISAAVLKHRFSDQEVFGGNAIYTSFFDQVCQELCQIF